MVQSVHIRVEALVMEPFIPAFATLASGMGSMSMTMTMMIVDMTAGAMMVLGRWVMTAA